ncbi:hypothetical protein VP01_1645g4 [Puccinia sorghi]|uniref:Uncharacterized protein n=1 Tax=Puccinia sorghi TaxID=27349 RepID=A0A0L6VGL4_9BASI|nr:hypothetical protein VP01_1645g4 [Puccinia sorghi]
MCFCTDFNATTLQRNLAQLPAVEMQHAPAKLPSKLQFFHMERFWKSHFTNGWINYISFLGLSKVNCRQLSKFSLKADLNSKTSYYSLYYPFSEMWKFSHPQFSETSRKEIINFYNNISNPSPPTAKKNLLNGLQLTCRKYQEASSLCRLHSDCAKNFTYENMWSLDGNLAGACCMSTACNIEMSQYHTDYLFQPQKLVAPSIEVQHVSMYTKCAKLHHPKFSMRLNKNITKPLNLTKYMSPRNLTSSMSLSQRLLKSLQRLPLFPSWSFPYISVSSLSSTCHQFLQPVSILISHPLSLFVTKAIPTPHSTPPGPFVIWKKIFFYVSLYATSQAPGDHSWNFRGSAINHCKKILLNFLQLTCRKSKEASVFTPNFLQDGVWIAAWLERAACQCEQVFFAVNHVFSEKIQKVYGINQSEQLIKLNFIRINPKIFEEKWEQSTFSTLTITATPKEAPETLRMKMMMMKKKLNRLNNLNLKKKVKMTEINSFFKQVIHSGTWLCIFSPFFILDFFAHCNYQVTNSCFIFILLHTNLKILKFEFFFFLKFSILLGVCQSSDHFFFSVFYENHVINKISLDSLVSLPLHTPPFTKQLRSDPQAQVENQCLPQISTPK